LILTGESAGQKDTPGLELSRRCSCFPYDRHRTRNIPNRVTRPPYHASNSSNHIVKTTHILMGQGHGYGVKKKPCPESPSAYMHYAGTNGPAGGLLMFPRLAMGQVPQRISPITSGVDWDKCPTWWDKRPIARQLLGQTSLH
jgi:hypothetical protein